MTTNTSALQNTFLKDQILTRFLRYAKMETTSDRHVEAIPSTPCQLDLARLLVKELGEIGVPEVEMDEHGYIIARLPANSPSAALAPSIGFMAHMDTASDVSGKDVKPSVHENYSGGDIVLSKGYTLSPADFPELSDRIGDTIITSDGTTLLGADDKAGVSEIMAAMAYLIQHPEIERGPLEIIFTPDEETGKGMDLFPLGKLASKACYTVDGGGLEGELEAECFYAYSVKASFRGRVIHIGSARGKLANAVSMAASFVTMIPRSESPESTDNRYGYYCPLEMHGDLENALVEVFLRDFEMAEIERRIEALKALAKAVEAQFPGGSVEIKAEKQYLNMREKMEERPEVMELLKKAVQDAGIEPTIKAIRGGTDGSRLTELGVPTPNIFTGGYNYHSRYEWASLSSMITSSQVIINLVRHWAARRA
jgi:tripeptide aminopeptidase